MTLYFYPSSSYKWNKITYHIGIVTVVGKCFSLCFVLKRKITTKKHNKICEQCLSCVYHRIELYLKTTTLSIHEHSKSCARFYLCKKFLLLTFARLCYLILLQFPFLFRLTGIVLNRSIIFNWKIC